jgi:hypothetical protein
MSLPRKLTQDVAPRILRFVPPSVSAQNHRVALRIVAWCIGIGAVFGAGWVAGMVGR